MGIGKLGKKLDKVARRARKTLGKRGRELAEAVLERAISILETELKDTESAKREGSGERSKRGQGAEARAKVDASRAAAPGGIRASKPAKRQGVVVGVGREPKPSRPGPGSMTAAAGSGGASEPGGPSDA